MKVLIFTISTGGGHNTSAKAICDYLESKNVTCLIIDAYEYISPILNDAVVKGYLLSTKLFPDIYGGIYRMAEKKKIKEDVSPISKAINKVLSLKLRKIIKEYMPDVIVNTHIFASQIVSALPNKDKCEAKTIGIITDFTVHPFWEDTQLDYYVTPTSLLSNQLVKKGIDSLKMLPFGIPIEKKFSKNLPKEDARAKIGVKNKFTVLIMMGSMGYGNITNEVKMLDNMEYDMQIICVCGSNLKLKKSLERKKYNKDVYVFGYINNVNVFMDSADVIITKPGGLTMSELLAKGLPAIINNPIPGQEDRNSEFLLNNGLCMKLSSTYRIDEALFTIMNHPERLEEMRGNSKKFGKPHAAKDLGEFIISLDK